MSNNRDTSLIWQALTLVTSAAAQGGPVTITIEPKDLEDMNELLGFMSDQNGYWQRAHYTETPGSPLYVPQGLRIVEPT